MSVKKHLSFLKRTLLLTKKSPVSLFKKIGVLTDYLRLYHRKGLTQQEYFDFSFWKQSEEFRQTFLGLNEQRYYLDYLSPIKYYILARNKFMAHKMLENTGIRSAELFCYYQPEGKVIVSDGIANDLKGVLNVLKEKNVKECVIKTTESSHGDNVYVVRHMKYEEDDCLMTLFDSQEKYLSELLGKVPLIFESVVKQNQQFSAFNESSINTVRFMTLLYPDGKARLAATWFKVGRSGKCVDNAGNGGNVDGCVDKDTGELKYVVQFDGWNKVKDIENHPDSGCQLEGVKIDNWKSIVEEVLHFQECFPYVKAAGWDIAITDEGPVVIEVNDFWDRTGQYFIRRGWRNEIRDCYLAWKSTGVRYPMERQPNKLSLKHLKKITKK